MAKPTTPETPHRKPSEATPDQDWVWAHAPNATPPDPDKNGKWMIRIYNENIDAIWDKIRAATEAGEFPTAKAGAGEGGPTGIGMIFVYVRDSHNPTEVKTTLVALRQLGITHRLNYKTDKATLEGNYGTGVSLYTSDPGSNDYRAPKHRAKAQP